ncbi:hypothetical protein ACTFIW_006347 [Dictyostelium discoideum]
MLKSFSLIGKNITKNVSSKSLSLSSSNKFLFGKNHENMKSIYSSIRFFSSEQELPPRDSDQFDVVIVGAGPSGLSTAIRLKQLSEKAGKDLRVCVVEKGSEVGSHILSGAVMDPKALNELIPDWKEKGAPLITEVKQDKFYFLTENRSLRLPTPRLMHNEGNYIISLGNVVRWLGEQAESMGVEVYPSFAASEVLYHDNGAVRGIATNDMGIAKDGSLTSNFTRGMELNARLTIFAEGCRGSLTKGLFEKFNLRDECEPQTFGLGIKETWEIKPEKHQQGLVIHTLGYPLSDELLGGSFIYHAENNTVNLGLVVGLDYSNPYLNPYQEFQKLKLHPMVKDMLEGGTCIQYGARTINEGGFQSIPKLVFPGGALVGCTAGFVHVPKVKGSHYAMKTGILAAEAAFPQLISQQEKEQSEEQQQDKQSVEPLLINEYPEELKKSWVWKELREVRNYRPSLHWGTIPGLIYGALEMYIFRGHTPWTLSNGKPDNERLKPAAECKKIEYKKPDGQITFDLMTSVMRSGTNHEENQPIHLKVRDMEVAKKVNRDIYDGPEGRFCPAGVYEWVEGEKGEKELVRNSVFCLHCKTCDIKDPTQNIDFTVPEGGGGPKYGAM